MKETGIGRPVDRLGRAEQVEGDYRLSYERQLRHPIEKVWAAISDPARIEGWLARAEIDLVEGGAVRLTWLNTDLEGNTVDVRGTITRLDPPRLLEMRVEGHELIRFELEPEGDGTRLSLVNRAPLSDEQARDNLAGWHVHLEFLERALDGDPIDWETDWDGWGLERFKEIEAAYEANRAA